MSIPKKICCLCHKEYKEWGNNAMPLKEGQCCDECNSTKVIPARLKDVEMRKIKCIFCKQDMSGEKFREDYTLVAWQDDPDEPESLTKRAETAHFRCYERFKEINNLREI